MKKILLLLILFSGFFYIPSTQAKEYAFAQIVFDNTYLYKTANDINSYDNQYFIIDRTYFVKVKEKHNGFYLVEYNGIEGYVKTGMVKFVSKEPQIKYVEGKSFRILGEQSRSFRTEPTSIKGTNSLIHKLSLYETNLLYIGKIPGEEIIPNSSNIWYYCKYIGEKVQYGYIFAYTCDKLDYIYENTEPVKYIDEPEFLSSPQVNQISKKNTNIIIGILCVPALLFTFFIIKSERVLTYKEADTKPKPKSKEISQF